ncbi:amidohydrolase [Spongiactinospora gelatinilytica]|uniref:Amidohydrolase n=1 Tax=Spongiactinospora gelatinilytica TaxID=2666298 RepID=A0A2W2H638_9ACTN|nr:amidohydrolase family protein [Spongiactinospora gelatinilytica]PZG41647.1 amidohydrolase [Spongiactinospora gelatinilytica]
MTSHHTPRGRPVAAPPDPDPTPPGLRLPPLSCDAHCHIFGPGDRFPYAEDRAYDPPDVSEADLRARHDLLGLERALIVQSAAHGTDHAALLDALRTGRGRYRGVALLTPDTLPYQVAELHEAGVRGVRLQFLPHLGAAPAPEAIRAVADLVRPYGWHVAFHVAGDAVIELADTIRGIGLPAVIDHMARVDLHAGLDGPQVTALRHLLGSGGVWVKLSAPERISRTDPPYEDAIGLARLLAADAPERVLWGTDFPHPNVPRMPDDGLLVDLIERIAPEEKARRLMLVDNPAALLDFPGEAR